MNFNFKKSRLNKIIFIFSFAFILLAIGCDTQQPQTANITVNTNATAVNAVNPTPAAPPAETAKSTVNLPVTLPVLDAMFADEGFANELKTKLQITDEQVDKLKTMSRQAVANLKEGSADDNAGSTRAAVERSGSQIREILGEEKTKKLFDLVSQRWNGGDEANNSTANNSASKPNSIPTDTRVVVNAPAYRMDLFQDGKLVKTYKIGIGYPEFPLPSGMRKASEIIFNPTWTPPDEPWVEGSNKVKVGEKVEAGSPLNPLGPIKIPIGLPSLIHGGKSPAKLGTFASHGCVGLTNKQVQGFSIDLANLAGMTLSQADVLNYAKQKTETKNVKLSKTIPVELRYETIVVENGKLKIFRDVYERGTNTEENLRAVFEAYGVSFDNLKEPDRKKILEGLKQMAIDATGQPVDASANKTNSNTKVENKNGSVTRNIKGKKEVFFDIAELKGKGYPAPVNFVQQ